MEHKNPMSRVERLHREKVTRYSIRKYSFGAASVAVAALFMFLGNGAVSANELSKQDTPSVKASVPASEDKPTSVESTPAVQPILEESTAKPEEATTPTLDKSELTSYISEVETKLANGTYANKTEESVAVLKAELESAKTELANATTQAQLKKAYSKLVTTVNTKLKAKPVEKKETPAVDTTNGKETVGKKAENTEKKSESNSIENTGSNDPRNGQRIPAGIQFRAEIAYAENANGTAYGNSNTYITSGIKDSTNAATAQTVGSKVLTYRAKYNTDATGKITSIDWMVFFNDYVENFNLKYGMDGKASRNYIQIPKEVNMPTEIKRVQYLADKKFGRPQDLKDANGTPIKGLSSVVTFDNPEPAKVGNAPRKSVETFSKEGWKAPAKGRDYDTLYENTETYFKDAVKVPETNAIVEANALPGKKQGEEDRVIYDQSNTGGDARDAYVWEFRTTVPDTTTNEQLKNMKAVMGSFRLGAAGNDHGLHTIATNPVNLSQLDVTPPLTADQTVKVGQKPDATKSIGNFDKLPKGTTAVYTTDVNTSNPGTVKPTVRVTYPDGSTIAGQVDVIVVKETVVAKPVIKTDLTGKAGTKDPVEVTAEPGSTVELFDKDNHKLGEAKADENGVARITPTADIPAGNVTAKATKDGKTSAVSDAVTATAAVAPTLDIPYSNKTEKQIYLYTTEESDISLKVKDDSGKVKEAVLKFPGGQNESYMTGGNKDAMYLKQEGMTTSEVTASEEAPHEIKLTGVIPKGAWGLNSNTAMTRILYAKDKDDKGTSDSFANNKSVNGYIRFVQKDQTVKYDIKTPAEADKVTVSDANNVTDAEFDKIKEKVKVEYSQTNNDERLADKKGQEVEDASKVVDKVEKEGNNVVVTYKDGSKDTKPLSQFVTKDTTAPAKPEVKTDLTGKAGTKDPVEVTAEPGSTVELFDKDGNKIGEGVANDEGKATITPTKDIPAGNVTAKATDKAGNTSDASEPKVATDTTAPAKPEVKTDLTGKAGTKDPVEVTAEPGSTVELFDKDGNKIGEGVANDEGKATITPTKEIPEGGVTAKATDPSGNVSDASEPKEATPAKDTTAPVTPVKPVTPAKTEVKDPANLTDKEKEAVKDKV